MVVAYSIFSFMVEFGQLYKYTFITIHYLKCLCTFILSHELVSFFFFIIKCTYSLRVGKLCWHDFERNK